MNRRRFVALSVLALPVRAAAQANAHVSTTDPLVYSLTKGKTVNAGRVRLELPKLAENGYTVPMTVRVDSPMTAKDGSTSWSFRSDLMRSPWERPVLRNMRRARS